MDWGLPCLSYKALTQPLRYPRTKGRCLIPMQDEINTFHPRITCAILTVSDRCAAGLAEDVSGPRLRMEVEAKLAGAEVVATAIVPDEVEAIRTQVVQWVDDEAIDLILTTGGTGFAPRDQTPEAVHPLLERQAPGLVVAMLMASLAITPHAMLSRPVAGIRRHSLLITLPGSPKGASENLQTLLPALPHALELLRDVPGANQRH
jgi:molybdenum cofactor synthesis domain-containing protein